MATTSQATEGGVTRTISRSYDTLGRLTSYTDADGKTTTRSYNVYDQLTGISDDRGTITYSYDAGSERRGLLTGLTASSIGTFTATYNADGMIATKTYPNDLVATTSCDETGSAVALAYDKTTNCGTACRWLRGLPPRWLIPDV